MEHIEPLLDDYVNDPELDGKFLGQISSDFVKVADTLKEACYHLRKRNISQYPIVVMAKELQPVGALLIPPHPDDEPGNTWSYYLSMMEEFKQRTLIAESNEEFFTSQYKDPEEFCCLFVLTPEFVRFVYIPYPED
ncbi:hypothetical protein [Umezakia ovalisporum]|uniref:hypothetical protein n=1 Tax=Umezakia ovalisporum TaxID=75695 RepID=UPI0039C624E5